MVMRRNIPLHLLESDAEVALVEIFHWYLPDHAALIIVLP